MRHESGKMAMRRLCVFCGSCVGSREVYAESAAGRRYLIMLGKDKLPDFPKTTVPEGSCFALGDHRSRSRDSREFGPIPLADVLGRARYIYYPAASWDRFGALREGGT